MVSTRVVPVSSRSRRTRSHRSARLPGLAWVHSTLMAYIGGEMVAGREAAEVSRDALVLLDDIEDLLGEKVLNYARRDSE